MAPITPNAARLIGREQDACALFAAVGKRPTEAAVVAPSPVPLWSVALEALAQMDHRAGWVDGRSDGTGLLTDLPRQAWNQRLQTQGFERCRAEDPRFWVLTVVTPLAAVKATEETVAGLARRHGFVWLTSHADLNDGRDLLQSHALWYEGPDTADGFPPGPLRFELLQALEAALPARIASFSHDTVILKLTHGPKELLHFLQNNWPGYQPRVVVGHNRFSTNTTTELSRVQPFLTLAHNGEIDTIDRLQYHMEAAGIRPVFEGSDSQNLDRLIVALMWQYGYSLAEAVRLAVQPSPGIIANLPPDIRRRWTHLETMWGPWAQGPVAVVVRSEQALAAAVDAMGLRPLWLLETPTAYVLTSEPGVVAPEEWVAEPYAIGPGECLAIEWGPEYGGVATVVRDRAIWERIVARVAPDLEEPPVRREVLVEAPAEPPPGHFVAAGWRKDDQALVKTWANEGREPIGSLGFDGPLAAMAEPGDIVNVADYLLETVAVVTNPALDREREAEHFRVEAFLGERPPLTGPTGRERLLRLAHPWLTDADLAAVEAYFGDAVLRRPLERTPDDLGELAQAQALAAEIVRELEQRPVRLLVLDDREAMAAGRVPADPHLVVGVVDRHLTRRGLRRSLGIVVRSALVRNMHDAMVLLGLGADAVNPYLIWALAGSDKVATTIDVMNGIAEKIASTMGIHETTGYGRVFSAIGLPQAVADAMGVQTFAAGNQEPFEQRRRHDYGERARALTEGAPRVPAIRRSTPFIYKAVHELAQGLISGEEFQLRARQWESKHAVALRHTLEFAPLPGTRPRPATAGVDLSVGTHSLPFVISSMSFGSQGETAFRAYAEAARALNIVAMNGEGGEIPDMVGRYYPWRGHQIASGRFGVNTALLNGAMFAEIKIGQGAKPGEGGHLPGTKVSAKVAAARNAVPGVDLISPSNNHDLYSIEDLQELIDELKEANPEVKVAVKVPVVPNIGTIAIGIVKAGADVVTLSGFEGGTGAARLHALRHVGLPADIGVPLVHTALTLAGLRHRAEIWCDGGMRSADDVLRMILLGANRVGWGTLSMVALGCTICRSCQTDTCHVGIATQIDSLEEAAKRGLKKFVPQELDAAVDNLVRFFSGLGDALAQDLRQLGFARLADAVGHSEYLRQTRFTESLNYEAWFRQLAELREEYAQEALAVGLGAESAPLPPMRPASSGRPRSWGTGLAGQKTRQNDQTRTVAPLPHVAGQGFGAFLAEGVTLVANGGAQDGVGKGASGGTLAVLKARGYDGRYLGGHAGKSLGYGAQGGTFIVQGMADARAGIRLAGADVIIAGDGIEPVASDPTDWSGTLIRGFGFEYMTRGRALILGDPGPWLASGMTGGVLFIRTDPARGLTREWIRSRIARNAKVDLRTVEPADFEAIRTMGQKLIRAYRNSGQEERIPWVAGLLEDPARHFVKVVPLTGQTDQDISTE